METQQSCDVTYRLYDYDRPAPTANAPAHMQQSLDCINFDAQAPTDGTVTAPEVDGVTELESCPCYTVDRVRVNGSKTLDQRWPFMCLSVIDGGKAPSAATPSTREATCWPRAPSAPSTSKAKWN